MALYAHWLDGEYARIIRNAGDSKTESLPISMQRMLKLHALFGSQIVLSDIQLIDSQVVLRLFADDSFRRFLDAYPSFFHLVAEPKASESGSLQFRIATRGFHRSSDPIWESSFFHDPNIVREMGDLVLAAGGEINPNRFLSLRDSGTIGHLVNTKWPKYKTELSGMLWGLRHFAQRSDVPIMEPPQNIRIQSFYEVLEAIAGQSKLTGEYEKYVDETINYINANVEHEKERHKRSSVYKSLRKSNNWGREQQTVWHTIVHAWNCAVENTLGANGSSFGNLPHSAPVGIYVRDQRGIDTLLPPEFQDGKEIWPPFSGEAKLLCLRWDPAKLSWDQITDVLKKTADQRNGFDEMRKSEGIDDRLNVYANALAGCFDDKQIMPDLPKFVWWMSPWIGTSIGWYFGNLVGQPESWSQRGACVGGSMKIAYESVDDLLRRTHRWNIANTLKEAGDRILP